MDGRAITYSEREREFTKNVGNWAAISNMPFFVVSGPPCR